MQIEASKAFESNDERFIVNLQKLHAQRLFKTPKKRNAICFYVVNDNKPEDGKIPQVIRCHLCYKKRLLYIPRTKLRKGLISYYKTNGKLALKKHVDVEHDLLAKKLDEKVNSLERIQVENQLTKKRENVSSIEISKFFFAKFLTRKMKCSRNNFLKI